VDLSNGAQARWIGKDSVLLDSLLWTYIDLISQSVHTEVSTSGGSQRIGVTRIEERSGHRLRGMSKVVSSKTPSLRNLPNKLNCVDRIREARRTSSLTASQC
jgi:hypothetical protein